METIIFSGRAGQYSFRAAAVPDHIAAKMKADAAGAGIFASFNRITPRPDGITTIPIMAVFHNRLSVTPADAEAVAACVASGRWTSGAQVARFEEMLAEIVNVNHVICVSSGSAALEIALGALDVKAGDHVVIPAYSCVALPNAVLRTGASPIPADVSTRTWNVASHELPNFSGFQPKAAILVNTFGLPCALPADVHDSFPIIEDCAHAIGVDIAGRKLGGRSLVGVASFYATKYLGCGEGGAIFTNSSAIADYARDTRDYTDKGPSKSRLNAKMTDIHAALGLSQLSRLPQTHAARNSLAMRYIEKLKPLSETSGLFLLPLERPQRAWYRFAISLVSLPPLQAIDALEKMGVHAALPIDDWRPPSMLSSSPEATRAYQTVLSLPLYPTLTHEEQDQVVKSFETYLLSAGAAN